MADKKSAPKKAKEPKAKPLPKELFIYRSGEGEDAYLDPKETLDQTVEHGETRIVGRYQLIEQVAVSTAIVKKPV